MYFIIISIIIINITACQMMSETLRNFFLSSFLKSDLEISWEN